MHAMIRIEEKQKCHMVFRRLLNAGLVTQTVYLNEPSPYIHITVVNGYVFVFLLLIFLEIIFWT